MAEGAAELWHGLTENVQLALGHHIHAGRGQEAFDLGAYATLKPDSTVNLRGLLHMMPLLVWLLAVAPACIIGQSVLQRALEEICRKHKLNTGGLLPAHWAKHIAASIRVALTHVRRLKNVPRIFDQRIRDLTAAEVEKVRELLRHYEPAMHRSRSGSRASTAESTSGTGPAEAAKESAGSAHARTLAPQPSSPNFEAFFGGTGAGDREEDAPEEDSTPAYGTGGDPTPRRLTAAEVRCFIDAVASAPVLPADRTASFKRPAAGRGLQSGKNTKAPAQKKRRGPARALPAAEPPLKAAAASVEATGSKAGAGSEEALAALGCSTRRWPAPPSTTTAMSRHWPVAKKP